MLMQAAPTDMRIPIQAALDFPNRFESPAPPLELARVDALEFEHVDHRRFPCIGLAYEAGRRGESYPAALNAANEEAVGAFLRGFIKFLEIPAIIEKVMDSHVPVEAGGLEAILEADLGARRDARSAIERLRGSAVGGGA
jgi:1-deoxy-D-xylulose-5-phosphate reductoisomerase